MGVGLVSVVVRVSDARCGIYEPLRMSTTAKKAFLFYRFFGVFFSSFEFFIVCLVIFFVPHLVMSFIFFVCN